MKDRNKISAMRVYDGQSKKRSEIGFYDPHRARAVLGSNQPNRRASGPRWSKP